MKKNALPCLILAAIMAAGSTPAVYGEEIGTTDIVSSQKQSDNEKMTSQNENEAHMHIQNSASENEIAEAESEETNLEKTTEEKKANAINQDFDMQLFFAEEEKKLTPLALNSVDSTSSITVRIRMDYPMTKAAVEQQNIHMEISPISIEERISPSISYTYLDENGNACENEDIVAAVDITAEGLPAGKAENTYNLTITGKGYRTFTYNDLSLADHAKIITIGSKESTFTLGDVNHDGNIDFLDQKLVEAALGTDSSEYDLNKDGKVNIVDISYVNRSMIIPASGRPLIQNGAMTAGAVVGNIDTMETDLSGIALSNNTDLGDLFTGDTAVSISKADSEEMISQDAPLNIPIVFSEGVAMSEVQISTPAANGIEEFQVIVETEENGKLMKETIPGSQTLRASSLSSRTAENVIVVNLGARMVVKKITIQVTKTADNETAVIKQIAFVESTLSKAPEAEAAKPKNVTVSPASKSVTLKWDAMANVTGYKVYYGTSQNDLKKTAITEKNQITIGSLENLQKYYFMVVGTNDGWESASSTVVAATPIPDSKPVAPTTLQVTVMDSALRFSWGKTENATGYTVYYREKGQSDWISKNVDNTTSFTVGGLTNGTTYEFCVEAYNQAGTSPRSIIAEGIPKSQEITGPELPAENRISKELISVRSDSGAAGNVNWNECPNFKISHVLDDNYNTFWQSGAWYGNQSFTFDFSEPQSMNYMIYVPRQGDTAYTSSIRDYKVTTYQKTSNGTYEIIAEHSADVTAKVIQNGTGYLVLEIPEAEDISRLTVNVGQWEGGKSVTLSEAAFYHLDDTPEQIADLFANGSFTQLKYSVSETLEKIDVLKERVESTSAFYLKKDLMLQELNDAKALAEGSILEVQNGFQSRSTSTDNKYGQTASILQPLGMTAEANSELVIYADLPDDAAVSIVPAQYYADAGSWQGSAIRLQNGRNVITVPQIETVATEKGGPLYLTYGGEHPEEIQLRIVANESKNGRTPLLELSNWYQMTESDRKDVIQTYVDEVTTYIQKKGGKLTQTSIWNHTDISTPSVLLSIPVKEMAEGLTADSLYDAILAWEDVSYVVNTTQGIVDTDREDYQYPMESRQNIRYMRMFGTAFMYAAGNHIGIGYSSAADLTKGQPVAKLVKEAESNGLYGWGIAHEIGHNMDKLGKAEITNNLYSLMVQSYDGNDMTSFPTRLETDGRYEAIFQKTAEARPGSANNVFVQLGMYWQLHLAYDNASDPMAFYREFFQLWKSGAYASGNNYDNRVALIASEVAHKDLTEFFTRWGMELTESTKRTLKTYDEETRATWYMNDDSRRNRLAGTGTANGILTLEPVSVTDSSGGSGQDVMLRFSHTDGENILGYEILRDGTSIAFTQETTYSDHIGTANNTVLTYSVRAIDKQGYPSEETERQQVRISYDNVLNADLYELAQEGTTVTITMKNDKAHAVTGIKLDQTTTSVTAYISSDTDGSISETTLTLSQNIASDNQFKAYFTKPEAEENDSRIWTYDATKIILENVPSGAYVQLIGAVNDDIAFFLDGAAIGRLSSDYHWGDAANEVIPADSLVIVGTYVGDPRYNYVQINGEFTVRDLETGTESKEIRPISGDSLLLSEIPEDGQVSLIGNGIFLYVVNEEAEDSLKGEHMDCDQPSSLPDRIQALIYRTDSISSTDGRITAKTEWITSPDADSLPSIILEQN